MPSRDDSGTARPVEPLGVVALENATIYPAHPSPDPHRMHYGVLREDGTLVESTVEDRNHGEHTFIPPDPSRFDGIDPDHREAIYAGSLDHAYGHFLLESCQRLWWAAEHQELPIVWTVDEKTAPELNRWERDLLEILGIGNEVIIVRRPTRFDRLQVPDAGYKYADWSHPRHIAFLAAYEGPPQEKGCKLWLSRDPAHGRGLINRHIIERKIVELGWTIATFELMPVRDQLDALARAEVIAGEEASTFHNLLLLKDITGKRFHVFRRSGPEHLSFTTIGRARDVDQHVHSCSHDAVLFARGRAVVRLAPNPAQYLSHLGIRIPPAETLPSDWTPGHRIRRLNRLAGITGAETYLQLGWLDHAAFLRVEVAHRDIVDDEFRFDVRSYRNQGAQFYEVSLEQFLTWFAKRRTYDLVRLDHQYDWRDALDKVRTVFRSAAHERTVVVLDNVLPAVASSAPRKRRATEREATERGATERGATEREAAEHGADEPRESSCGDIHQTVLAIRDLHPELDFRTIGTGENAQTLVWQRRRKVRPRFAGEEEIGASTYADLKRPRDLFAMVSEDRAMAELQDWLSPPPVGRLARVTTKVQGLVRSAAEGGGRRRGRKRN